MCKRLNLEQLKQVLSIEKVLEHYGLISYSKSGLVVRLKDTWELRGKVL